MGTISVTGTKFTVQLLERKGATEMITKAKKAAMILTVAVMVGKVNVEYDGKNYELSAGAEHRLVDRTAFSYYNLGYKIKFRNKNVYVNRD